MPMRDIVVSITLGAEAEAETASADEGPAPPKKGKGKKEDAQQRANQPGDPDADDAAGGGKVDPPADPKKDPPEAPAIPESPVIKIAASSSYADTTQAFVARFSRNLIGKNQLTIEVNDRGLLNSAKSETTSELSQIFSALASAAGSEYAASYGASTAESCPKKVSMVIRIDPAISPQPSIPVPNSPGACNVVVKVKAPTVNVASNERSQAVRKPQSGFFYRQNLPYTVTVTFDRWTATDVVMLPNASPVQFLPVEKSLFANNTSDLAFSDGVLTRYGQTVDGEALAVAKLPAEVLKAYFAAIGAMFTSRKDASASEAGYLDAMLTLTKKQVDTEVCLAAYRSQDEDRIAKDCN
jgi:hypothetical protein